MNQVQPDQDWIAAEPKLTKMVIADLQRLKYRARARIIPITLLAIALTGVVLWRFSLRPAHHHAKVVLAIQEGREASRETLIPVYDLRGYVTTILMPKDALIAMIEKHDLFPLRHSHGIEFALTELWDVMEIEVYRNYFLYDYDETEGEGRSARIGVSVDYPDPDLAYEIARDVATIIVNAAAAERDATARKLETGARLAGDAARRRVLELELQAAQLEARRDEAVGEGALSEVAGLNVEIASVLGSLKSAHEAQNTIAQRASAEELRAQVYAAGLSLDVAVVEERRPEPIVPNTYRIAVLTVVVFVTLFVLVALYVGAFDTRIHDLDDVSRLGIPVVGQVPGFPGDGVGSLRDRGVTRRGVPWSSR
jgi:hypothetical protein